MNIFKHTSLLAFVSNWVMVYGLNWNDTLLSSWTFIQSKMMDPYQVPLIHRPRSEMPGDCVSEGVGYGMLSAYFVDDQTTFDVLWTNANHYMWTGQWYNWRVNEYGALVSAGGATDAEQDIAAVLFLAQRRVDAGLWVAPQGLSYRERAQDIVNNMWWQRMISPHDNIAPGAGWGGDDFINPGYFAPLWYRLFSEEDENRDHAWDRVIDQGYASLSHSPGLALGLVPDWMTPTGGYVDNLGYNSYGNGRYLYKDAIRIFWRIGTDFLHSNDPRAKDFLEKAVAFLPELEQANFYTMEGQVVPCTDTWVFNGGQFQRPRCEHSALTVGMWAIAHHALGLPTNYFLEFFDTVTGEWKSDAYPNEYYFEQFLALFSAITLADKWVL